MNDSLLNTAAAPVVDARALGKRFVEGALDVRVLDALDMQVLPGQTVAIVGASGSGKSTLLQILGGLDVPSAGDVRLKGRSWQGMNATEQGQWRNQHVGFVYQFHHLLAEFSALDNVAMPLLIRRMPIEAARAAAQAVLAQVGLAARLAHKPAQLSGGERQRVAVARALVTRPACLLADEPTGNLDRSTAQMVFEQMVALSRQQGSACVVVTHDPDLAMRCDVQWRLDGGRLGRLLPQAL
jgi:lipoprotein-releasing system ATP-binding protein